MSAKASPSIDAAAKNTPVSGKLFFLDLSGGRVLSANPDGSDLKTIINEARKLPDGLVLDVAAGHIYWTNMGDPKRNDGSIMRSDLNGKSMITIVPPGGTFTPKQLQLEKRSGKLYWSDREGMRVMRANLDGSEIESLVDTSQGDSRPGPDQRKWCVGIAVDTDGGKFYWTQKGGHDAGLGRIFRMRQKERAVTGAGVAGLAAAYRLSQRNWEVTVLEATDRVGGRVAAYHSDGAPEHKEMRRLCSRLSLPLQKHPYANSFWNQTARASLSAPGSWCMSPKSDAIWKNFQKKFRTSTPHQWRQLDKIDYSNGRHYGFRSIGPTESGHGPCTV